jgi:uncharacterized protein
MKNVSGTMRMPMGNAAVGLVTGSLGGLIGLGGAEFRLPWLAGWLGLLPREAVPINLAITLATLSAALPARSMAIPLSEGLPHLPEVMGLMAGAMVAAFFAAGWASRISHKTFAAIILVLLMTLGIVLLTESVFRLEPVGLAPEAGWARFLIGTALGLGIGIVSSLLGVAGGEIIIPVLAIVFAAEIKIAGSLSLIISLPVVMVGLGRYIAAGALGDRAKIIAILLPMAAGSIIGAAIGGLAVGLVPAHAIKALLGVVLIWSAWKCFRHVGNATPVSDSRRATNSRNL